MLQKVPARGSLSLITNPGASFLAQGTNLNRALLALTLLLSAASGSMLASDSQPQGESTELAARTAAYFNPDRAGEGIFVEMLPGSRALVYLFSYGPKYVWGPEPRSVLEPRQNWMLGVGEYADGRIYVDRLLMPTGGHFGPGFNAAEIEFRYIGPLFFVLPGCGTSPGDGLLEIWTLGPDTLDYQDLEYHEYVQLSQVLDCETGVGSRYSHHTGSWFDPDRAGEGFILQVMTDGRALVQWMTWDKDGGQMWIQGMGEFDEERGVLDVDELYSFNGAYWGSDFDPADVTPSLFGRLTMAFQGCQFAVVNYESPEFGSGTYHLERLTWPLHINDAGIGCWDY